MRVLSLIFLIIIFELVSLAFGSSMEENKSLLDIPEFKGNDENFGAVELKEDNITENDTIIEFETSMPPKYIAVTWQLSNSCSDPLEKATEKFKNQKYEEAIIYLNETIRICPDLADVWYNRGYCQFQLMRYNEALDDFNMAVELDPTNADYLTFKGITLIQLKKYYEALSSFNTSININPNLSSAKDWKAHLLEALGA